jgi:hypothetical protein
MEPIVKNIKNNFFQGKILVNYEPELDYLSFHILTDNEDIIYWGDVKIETKRTYQPKKHHIKQVKKIRQFRLKISLYHDKYHLEKDSRKRIAPFLEIKTDYFESFKDYKNNAALNISLFSDAIAELIKNLNEERILTAKTIYHENRRKNEKSK